MVDQQPAKFTTYDTSDDGYSGIFEVPDGSFYHHEEVDRAIAQRDRRIAELEAERRWIQVGDRLPDEGSSVLAYRIGVFRVTFGAGCFWDGDEEMPVDDVTHWMPLPKPPEVSDGE